MSSRPSLVAASLTVLLAGSALGGVPGAALTPAVAAAPTPTCSLFFDADHDGHEDLAIGTPGEDVTPARTATDTGVVTLVHADAMGRFGTTGGTLLTQEDLNLVSTAGDRFGAAVATADLNGDSCGDLVIGIPGKSAGAGAVVVVWGSPTGLDKAHRQLLAQGTAYVGSVAEAGDGFGSTLAVTGSLPAGGAASLWVGSPGEDVGTVTNAGQVNEIKATAGGLLGTAGHSQFEEDTPGVPGLAQAGDRFGDRLSGSERTLLVGVPHEHVGTLVDAGAYYVVGVYSSTRNWVAVTQDSSGVPDHAEAGDWFGSAVAHEPGCAGAGDENWAIGSSGEDIGSVTNAGTVTVRDWKSQLQTTIRQGAGGVTGPAEPGDVFGSTLVDAGGVLVVGAPSEDVGTVVNAGTVTVTDIDCTATDAPHVGVSTTWSQSSADQGVATANAGFGRSLGVSLVDTGGPALELRLVVGSPGQNEGVVHGSGTVTVFGTTASGLLTATGSTSFGQGTSLIDGDPQQGDGFGGSLDATNAVVL